jgi:hypothetical protein
VVELGLYRRIRMGLLNYKGEIYINLPCLSTFEALLTFCPACLEAPPHRNAKPRRNTAMAPLLCEIFHSSSDTSHLLKT